MNEDIEKMLFGLNNEQKVEVAIRAALEVVEPLDEPWSRKWKKWAMGWLSDRDRTKESTIPAAKAAEFARAERAAAVAAYYFAIGTIYSNYIRNHATGSVKYAAMVGVDVQSIIDEITAREGKEE